MRSFRKCWETGKNQKQERRKTNLTVIDTSVLIELIKGSPDAVGKIRELLEKNDRIATTIITVYELLKGANLSAKRQRNLQHVRDAISNIHVLDLSPDACEEASDIFYE